MQPASVFYHSTVKFPNKNVLVIGGSGFGKTRFWLRLNLMQLPMRPLEQSGEWGAKSKKEYILNKDGQRIKRKDGSFKDRKIDTVDWNDKGKAEIWQQAWADVTNKYLAEQNIPQRVDHRSYKRQGIEQIPTEHMGVAATQMERKGL